MDSNEDQSSQNGGTYISLDGLLDNILQRLPVKSLVRFKTVCKQWRDLISDSTFIKSHLNFHYHKHNVSQIHLSEYPRSYRLETLDVLLCKIHVFDISNLLYRISVYGSCNGLLLVVIRDRSFLINPSIREHLPLYPPLDIWKIKGTEGKYFISGLGYNSVLDEYKAVMLVAKYKNSVDDVETQMFILSSRIGFWNEVDHDLPFCIANSRSLGTTVNGFPHWAVHDSKESVIAKTTAIMFFDVIDDKLKRVPTPILWIESYDHLYHVSLFGKCLCAVMNNFLHDSQDVWVMNEYGVEESWVKLFVIPRSHNNWWIKPLGYTNSNDEVVLEVDEYKIVTFNIKTMDQKHIVTNKAGRFYSVDYVDSLVSPYAVMMKEAVKEVDIQ